MSEIAVRVEHLGKLYRIGQTVGYKTLRESLTNLMTAPFRRSRAGRGTSGSGEGLAEGRKPDHIWALDDVSFEIKRGEAVGIIGRNGSGKSTLLKILSRITMPTRGYAEMYGRVGSLLEVGTGFHPELTGRENIYLNGAILGLKRTEIATRFDEIVAFAEIEKFLDTPVKRYSSGMYVRLAFAVAAHLEPDILLLDEVLAVGDAAFQKKCLGKMEGFTGEGRTVIFVSHNMAAVQELCARAILLQDGCTVEDAVASAVIQHYLSTESHESSGNADITDPSLRRGSLPNSLFRWTRVTILNSGGRATAVLGFGEPFEILLQGIAEADISDVRAGFAINSALGVPVFNSFQTDQGLPTQLPVGKVQFRVRIDPNLLAPGLYEIGLGAAGNDVRDWLPAALAFNIASTGQNNKVWSNYRGGLLVYPCEWHLEPAENE